MQTMGGKGEGVIKAQRLNVVTGNVVSEMDTGIMCEVYDMWHHAKCEGVSDGAYTVLQGNEAMHWYCKGCNKVVARLL